MLPDCLKEDGTKYLPVPKYRCWGDFDIHYVQPEGLFWYQGEDYTNGWYCIICYPRGWEEDKWSLKEELNKRGFLD